MRNCDEMRKLGCCSYNIVRGTRLEGIGGGRVTMWQMDPELARQLQHLRRMVHLSQLAPTKEWPLVFMADHDELLIVREWPNGEITAYTARPCSSSG